MFLYVFIPLLIAMCIVVDETFVIKIAAFSITQKLGNDKALTFSIFFSIGGITELSRPDFSKT